jgi:hypothetical protein
VAKQLDQSEVDFTRRHAVRWFNEEWANDAPWMLEKDVDFQAKPSSQVTRLYAEAAALGKAARVKVLGDGNILFQTYTPTPEEAARKAAAVSKRAATRAANAGKPKASAEKKNGKASKPSV